MRAKDQDSIPGGVSSQPVTCFHCGQHCDEIRWHHDKLFCCFGCQTVFEILTSNDLCEYYAFDSASGSSLKDVPPHSFSALDDAKIRMKILTFESEEFARVSLYVPAVHCISCIWLLENLRKIEPGILRSEVNFAKKMVSIDFNPASVRLGRIADLLASLGYAPEISLDQPVKTDRSLILRLAVAGFCFGNIMLFSFPEYLGLDHSDLYLMRLFSWLNVVLSLPVFFFSALDYFRSALASFRQKQINIDVPIAAGLVALFSRSIYDIVTASGPGYLDSFAGLVFFLLIGRWFQGKTYESLAFDRDFKSFFPLSIHKLEKETYKPVMISALKRGDMIRVRGMEIIPADCILTGDQCFIDYSFVTGESRPVKVTTGNSVYAGGRLIGQPVTFIVEKETSQSLLTTLWNHESFRKKNENTYRKIIDRAARNFTWIIMVIAVLTAVYWQINQPSRMWLVLTSVLMVACPCALALAAPFTYGSMLRAFGKNRFYLKNADVVERLGAVDTIVFDKTGTVTHGQQPDVGFSGTLTDQERSVVRILTSASTHPLSQLVAINISGDDEQTISNFREIPGKGVQGTWEHRLFKVGSAEFVNAPVKPDPDASHVFVSVDGEIRGYFSISISVRENVKEMIARLGNKCFALLSGDNGSDFKKMSQIFGPRVLLHFNQSPHDKLEFIRNLQRESFKVLMVGDGLNDSGALKQSDVGIAVSDSTAVFTPACDGILMGDQIGSLDRFVDLAAAATAILKASFAISFAYNAVALGFAVTGNLTPLVAAILMPLSSISVVGFSSLAVRYITERKLQPWKSPSS